MKLRINSDSFRFRITEKELEELVKTGQLEVSVGVPGGAPGQLIPFRYRIQTCLASEEPGIELEPFGMTLRLDWEQIADLRKDSTRGVYIEETWMAADGKEGRFLVYVQQDLGCRHPGKRGSGR